jgi:hypothetical protein
MITGAHSIIYSTDAGADRDFLRDVLGLRGVDAGGGWLIFGLPPAEVAVHPGDGNDQHELYLLCDDVAAFVAAMQAKGVACDPVSEQRWGLLTAVTLPGGGKLGVYEPRHARPKPTPATRPAKRPPARGGKTRKPKPKRKARAAGARRR